MASAKPPGRFPTAADFALTAWLRPRQDAASDAPPPDGGAVASPAPALHFITVHGTWGRGFFPDPPATPWARCAPWCTPKSPFFAELGRRLQDARIGYRISDFLWSGANSVTVRNEAAGLLARHIARLMADEPNTHPVIVAHSHGGNVALRALERLRKDYDIELGGRLSLVTVATPFVQISPPGKSWIKTFSVLNTGLMFFLFIFSLIAGLIDLSNLNSLAVIAVVAVCLLLLRLMLLGTGLGRVDDPATFPPALIEASHYPPYDGSFNFLIVRGEEDEATMTLMLSALGNRIIDVLIATAGYLVVGCGVVFGTVFVVHYSALGLKYDIPTLGPLGFTFWVLLGVSSCVYLATRMAALCRSCFGRELYASALQVAVSAHSVPDLRSSARVVTLPRIRQADISLLHSLYNHEQCAEEIASWLREKNASR